MGRSYRGRAARFPDGERLPRRGTCRCLAPCLRVEIEVCRPGAPLAAAVDKKSHSRNGAWHRGARAASARELVAVELDLAVDAEAEPTQDRARHRARLHD